MGRWTDIATWGGPASDNFGDGDTISGEPADRMSAHRGLVIHIAEGSYTGTVSWEDNPDSDISSHWVLARDGRCVQMVDTDDRPWTQAEGNSEWLSVECEGYAGDSLTPAMVEVLAQLLARAHEVYGVPLQLADSPSGRGLGWHGMGGAAWGGHTGCPGAPIVAQRPAIIARAQQIAEGGDDVSQHTDAVIDAWRQGNPVAGDGTQVEPVKWRMRDEAWQKQITGAVAALAERPGVALGDAQLAAIADLVAARLGDRLADAVADRLAERLAQ